MLRVGLTGGIGSGKSTVGRMFVDLGARLIDADAIVHLLFAPGHAVNDEVVRAFGDRVRAADGSIDRPVLGEIVFSDPSARQRLNALVHPGVIRFQKQWLDELEAHDPQAIGIVEAALMVEVGTYRNYDRLIVVSCSGAVQRRRLRERSGLSEEQIEARIAAQMPLEEKVKYADFIIDNSGALEDTRRQVKDVYERLRSVPPPARSL